MALEILYYGKEAPNRISDIELTPKERQTLEMIKTAPRLVHDSELLEMKVEFVVPADQAEAVFDLLKKLSDSKVIGETDFRFEEPRPGSLYDYNHISPNSFCKLLENDNRDEFLKEEATKNKETWRTQGRYRIGDVDTLVPGDGEDVTSWSLPLGHREMKASDSAAYAEGLEIQAANVKTFADRHSKGGAVQTTTGNVVDRSVIRQAKEAGKNAILKIQNKREDFYRYREGDEVIYEIFGNYEHDMFSDPDRSFPAISTGMRTEKLAHAKTYDVVATELDKLREFASQTAITPKPAFGPSDKDIKEQLLAFLDAFETKLEELSPGFRGKSGKPPENLIEGEKSVEKRAR